MPFRFPSYSHFPDTWHRKNTAKWSRLIRSSMSVSEIQELYILLVVDCSRNWSPGKRAITC